MNLTETFSKSAFYFDKFLCSSMIKVSHCLLFSKSQNMQFIGLVPKSAICEFMSLLGFVKLKKIVIVLIILSIFFTLLFKITMGSLVGWSRIIPKSAICGFLSCLGLLKFLRVVLL